MLKKDLVKELATKVRKYQAKAKTIVIDKDRIGDIVFIQEKNETIFNPKYLKVEDYYAIKALEAFLKVRSNLTTEEVAEVINSDKAEFEFLQKLYIEMPTLIEDLKANRAKVVAINYINNLLFGKNEEDVLGQ